MGFAVVDVETTGLNPQRDVIVEIGVVLLESDGSFLDQWSSLVNPLQAVRATFIHGITDDDVAQAPSFGELIPHIHKLLAGRAIVAHNAAFDVGFLNASFKRCDYPVFIPASATVCTMELSKIYLPPGRHGLVHAAERAGITMPEHHRALADAHTSAQLLRHYLVAESSGRRYADHATSREGKITLASSWLKAQEEASRIVWINSLL